MALVIQEAEEAHRRIQALMNSDQDLYESLGHRLRSLNPAFVFSLARGSSDHAMTYASYLFPLVTGRVVASLPPSVVTVLKSHLHLQGQCCLTVSQSGSSPDILTSTRTARAAGALCIGVTNHAKSPLAQECDYILDQYAGPEVAVAATKTVLCTQAVLARIAATWSEDQALLKALKSLPEALRIAFQKGISQTPISLSSISHVYVISRSLGMGAAYEMALKIKEMCGIHAEAFSSAEVRHGPREIVNENYLVIGLAIAGSGDEDVTRAVAELEAQGAKTFIIGSPSSGAQAVLPDNLDFRLQSLAALNFFYPWLARSAQTMGRDPDKPVRLQSKVVHTI